MFLTPCAAKFPHRPSKVDLLLKARNLTIAAFRKPWVARTLGTGDFSTLGKKP